MHQLKCRDSIKVYIGQTGRKQINRRCVCSEWHLNAVLLIFPLPVLSPRREGFDVRVIRCWRVSKEAWTTHIKWTSLSCSFSLRQKSTNSFRCYCHTSPRAAWPRLKNQTVHFVTTAPVWHGISLMKVGSLVWSVNQLLAGDSGNTEDVLTVWWSRCLLYSLCV